MIVHPIVHLQDSIWEVGLGLLILEHISEYNTLTNLIR